jgi:hypothetical protein
VGIDVRVDQSDWPSAQLKSSRDCQPGPPRAFTPRQIKSLHVAQWKPADKGNTGITFIVQTNLFFEIQPPLAFFGSDAARDSGGGMYPRHPELCTEIPSDVLTAGTNSPFVSFLHCEKVKWRTNGAGTKGSCALRNVRRNYLSAFERQIETDFPQ